MLHKPEKRGRPPGPKLEQADAEYIKEQIRQEEGWHILAVFYRDVFEWNKRKKYRRFKKPKDVVSVESAFMAWFSGKRPLPKLYESILDELLGNWRDDLPSRRTSANAKGGESAWAPLDRAPEIKTLAATAAPVPGRIKIHAKIWPDGNMEVSCYDLATDRWEDYPLRTGASARCQFH